MPLPGRRGSRRPGRSGPGGGERAAGRGSWAGLVRGERGRRERGGGLADAESAPGRGGDGSARRIGDHVPWVADGPGERAAETRRDGLEVDRPDDEVGEELKAGRRAVMIAQAEAAIDPEAGREAER